MSTKSSHCQRGTHKMSTQTWGLWRVGLVLTHMSMSAWEDNQSPWHSGKDTCLLFLFWAFRLTHTHTQSETTKPPQSHKAAVSGILKHKLNFWDYSVSKLTSSRAIKSFRNTPSLISHLFLWSRLNVSATTWPVIQRSTKQLSSKGLVFQFCLSAGCAEVVST